MSTEKGRPGVNKYPQTCREPYWKELTADEKIERMRGEVKSLIETVVEIKKVINDLAEHSHQDNKIIIPFDKDKSAGYGTLSRSIGNPPDGVYF